MELVDVAVIGSGVGGLTTAALLARRGLKVHVYEQHLVPGGSASFFERRGYHFDVGASLLYTLGAEGKANFLYRILQEIDEPVTSFLDPVQIHYHLPNGLNIRAHYQRERFLEELIAFFPQEAAAIRQFYRQLDRIFALMDSLDYISLEDPIAGLKFMFTQPLQAIRLACNSFSDLGRLANRLFRDPVLRRFIDLECYSWALADAEATPLINAAIVLADRHVGGVRYPQGGISQIPLALARAVEKFGGRVHYRSRVDRIWHENGQARGLYLKTGEQVAARYVVSNATIWNTATMLADSELAAKILQPYRRFETSRSFFSIFSGVPIQNVPADYSTHHIIVNDWEQMAKDDGTIYVSIPSILDPSVAPAGYHNLHVFTVQNYQTWQRHADYRQLKEQHAATILARLPFAVQPDFSITATPLTNERYLRRQQGSYGPLYRNGRDLLLKPKNLTPLPHLYCVGDSCFPGQGVSAVAASGVSCAMLIAKRYGIPWNK
jgi:prolycopene isomerase